MASVYSGKKLCEKLILQEKEEELMFLRLYLLKKWGERYI